MADFTDPGSLKRAGGNAAAPLGLTQTTNRLGAAQNRYLAGETQLAPWMPQETLLETAKQWYGGANSEGITNGWNTDFYANAFKQQDEWYTKAGESGRGSTWFGWLDKAQNPTRTGVATWDDPTKNIRFGDVYNNGAKVGNLYDDYDEQTADVMAGEFMLTQDEKARYFKDPNRASAYREIIEQRRQERSNQALYAKSAEDFEKNVESTETSLHKGWGDEAVVAGAAAATAAGAYTATVASSAALAAGAAALGFSWTGPGALVAAAIAGTAAAIGGTAAYLNRDQLVEHTARAWEKTDAANGAYQTFGVAVSELGGLGIQFMNPVGNSVKGLYDVTHGEGGDQRSEWYERTAEGERQPNNFWKTADVVAAVADSIFQFASPLNRAIYMSTMGASTVGGTAELFTGQGFNDRRGQFQDYESGRQWMAAVGGVFIDAAQLGTAGLLASAAKSTRQFAGLEAKETLETRNWLTRKGDEAFEKLKGTTFSENVASYETINGIRFAKDAQGNVISSRITAEALVPSEFLRWLPTGWRARTYQASQRGMVTGDDLYRAAVEMTRGQSKFRDAFISAYAEGGEEFTQAILEPVSFGEQINYGAAADAALYGAAGGFGMGLKMAYSRAPNQEILKARAAFNEMRRTGGQIDMDAFNERWAKADQVTRERMAVTSPDDGDMAGIVESMTEMARMDYANQSAVGLAKANSMRQSAWEQASRKVSTAGDGSLVLMGIIGDTLNTHAGTVERYKYVPNSAQMTAFESVRQIRGINEGMAEQYNSIQAEMQQAIAERDEARASTRMTAEEVANLQAAVDRYATRLNDLDQQQNVSQQVVAWVEEWYSRWEGQDQATQIRMIEEFNETIRRAFDGEWKNPNGVALPPEDQQRIQRAVELKMARHPLIDTGSYSILMPQISVELTRINAHATIYMHQSTLKTLGADHDGDTKVPMHGIYLPPEDVQRARRGTQYVREMTAEEKAKKAQSATNPEKWAEGVTRHTVVSDPPDGETSYIRTFHQTGWDPQSDEHDAVIKGLNKLIASFRYRYGDFFGGPLEQFLLDPVLEDFKNNVLAGRKDARQVLLDEIWNLTPNAALQLFQMADSNARDTSLNKMPEVLWMQWSINNTWDNIQREIAYIHAKNKKYVSTVEPEKPPPDNTFLETKARRDAHTAGAALSMLGANDPTRLTQFLHYSSLYQSTVDVAHLQGNNLTSDQQMELTALYALLGSNEVRSESARQKGRNAIEDRVINWLVDMVNSGVAEGAPRPPMETMLLLANTMVPEVTITDTNTYQVTDGRITMLQLLLKKSLEIEENIHRGTDPESAVNKKIQKLKGLTNPTTEHSYTATTAMVEVLGNLQLHELLGDSALYIGPSTTLNQLVQQLKGLHERTRSNMVEELRRAPDYISHHGTGDPPWPAKILMAGDQMNAFTMLVDAVATTAATARKEMVKKDQRVHKSFLQGHTELRTTLEGWAKTNAERLGEKTKDPKEVLRDLLKFRPEIAAKIADLIPEAANLGVFQQVGGKMYAAKWLEEFLTEKDSERAAVIYYVNVKFAEFNQLGGTIDPTAQEQGEEPAYKVKYGRIQSRFLQSVYHMATKPDQIDLNRFIKAASSAASLDALFKLINEEPSWRNNRERLLPWHDDVALFEVDPRDVWNPSLPGTLQRENIKGWGDSMKVVGKIAVESATNFEANKTLLRKMKEYMDNPTDTHTHKNFVELLQLTIDNRKMFPDTQGQAARDQAIELMQDALIRMHDKGKADEMIRSWGESIVLMDGEGYSSGLRQEVDATTAKDFRHLRTNLTHLVQGPVRVMMPDGSTVRMDLSEPKQALAMLMDPRTQGFAIAVLFPTVRDVNDMNVTQVYLDSDHPGNIGAMLEEQTYSHLFSPQGIDEEGTRQKLQQAHRYVGTLEAYIRRKNSTLPREEAEQKFAPIQNMINDVLMAYSHSPAMEGKNKASVRAQLVIDVVEAIKATANVEDKVLDRLQKTIADKMRERFLGDTSGMSTQLLTDLERTFLEAGVVESVITAFHIREQELEAEIIAEQNKVPRDQAKIDQLNTTWQELVDAMDAVDKSPDPLAALPQHRFKAVATVLNGFRMTGDTANDMIRKGEILSILERKNRLRMFMDKDTKDLIHRVRQTLHTDPLALTTITDEEWETLGEWAMQTVIADMTSRSSSDVAMNPIVLGVEGAQVHRYYDVTYAYLTDTLFDTDVLEGARALALTAGATSIVTDDEASTVIMKGLLNENKLGVWSDRIPMESLKARKVLRGSMVGAAVQLEGNDPKEMADYVGSGWMTYKRPQAEHMTKLDKRLAPNENILDVLNPLDYVKLQNHFVGDMGVTIGGQTYSLMQRIGKVSQVHDSVTRSKFRVLDLFELEQELTKLKARHPGEDLDLTITYVDADKMPHKLEWANNVYFEGVGREATAGAGGGAIASLFFGLGALSKLGQQNPLDMAAKKGKGFRQHITTRLDEIEAMEQRGAPIAETLGLKALHLWKQEYEHGPLLTSDLPALYKLMKMRHVVVGYNANGEKEVWWPQQVIEAQQRGIDAPLNKMQLIPLSDSVAQTLLGGGGHMGVEGVMTRPVFNLQDMDRFPLLSKKRLRELGLTRLGEETRVGDSEFAKVSAPPKASMTSTRGKAIRSRFQAQVEVWRGQKQTILDRRSDKRREGAGKFDIDEINKAGARKLEQMLTPHTLADLFQKLGVPTAGLIDMGSLDVSMRLVAQLAKVRDENSNAMIWQHMQSKGQDLAKGILGRADVQNNFRATGGVGPTYGDIVVIDLEDMLAAVGGDWNEAVKQGKETLRAYAEKGVIVTFASAKGDFKYQNELAEWMRGGEAGYRPMNNSSHIFVPIDDNPNYGTTRLSLEDTLTEVTRITAQGVALGLVSDTVTTDLSENASVVDYEHDTQWNRIVHAIMPTALTATGSAGDSHQYAFNVPAKGIGDTDQVAQMRDTLLPLLQTQEGMDHLIQLASGYKKPLAESGDPKGVNVQKVHKDAQGNPTGIVDPGILGIKDALIELRDLLQANQYPLESGRVLQTGSLIPLIAKDGSIILSRVGFKAPSWEQLRDRMNAPRGSGKEVKGEPALRVGMYTDELDVNQSVPPPFTVNEVHFDDERGLTVRGEFKLNAMSKMVLEGVGFKAGVGPLPNWLKFPPNALSNINDLRVTQIHSETSVVGKQGTPWLGDNYRNWFAITGFNAKPYLLDFFFPGRDPADEGRDWNDLEVALRAWAVGNKQFSASDIDRALDAGTYADTFQNEINQVGEKLNPGTWQPVDLGSSVTTPDPKNRLVGIIMATLAAPGINVEDVVETAGLMTVSNRTKGGQITLLPPLLADAMADPSYPELRELLHAQINGALKKYSGSDNYFLDQAWNFHINMEVNGQPAEYTGFLQINLPIPANENAVSLAQASLTTGGQESAHNARVTAGAIGGWTATKPPKKGQPDPVEELFGKNQVLRFEEGSGELLWDALRRISQNDQSYTPWQRSLPMEDMKLQKGKDKVSAHSHPIPKGDWGDDAARVQEAQDDFLAKLNMSGDANRVEVDYLVRQFTGRPGPMAGQQDYHEAITAKVYLQVLSLMKTNITNNRHPLHGGAVPLEHRSFWEKVYRAQLGLSEEKRWKVVYKEGKGRKRKLLAKDASWADWVDTLLGQMRNSNEPFHSMFREDLDGFWHTYNGATPSFSELALSTDELISMKLMDPDTNELYLSMDTGEDALLKNPVLLDSMEMTYAALIGHEPGFSQRDARDTPASSLSEQLEQQEAWLKNNKMAAQDEMSVRDYVREGAHYRESNRATNGLLRGAVNLSITMRLANPALYFSALFEVPFRNLLEHTTNLLTGQHIGMGGKWVATAGEGGLTAMLGVQSKFSPEEIKALRGLAKQLGASNEFLAELYGEMIYSGYVEPGAKKSVGKLLERSAQATARMTSDPRWGMMATSVAMRYLEASWEYMSLTDNLITVPQFIQQMEKDPLWLRENSPKGRFSAHRAGMNRVAQVRSTKATVLGNTIMAPIEAMGASSMAGVNFAGHLLKIPFLFTRFNANAFMTLSGLQSIDQVMAMFLDGRKRPKILNRMSAIARQKNYDPEALEFYDMSHVIESVDLSRAFVKGAVTHTGLMTMGMMLGSLGLGGEDEEEARRRRLAEYLNIPNNRDPRKAVNDFLWADAIFLDNIPGLNTIFMNETGHAAVVPHWMFRQFLSPVLGMMKFFETGNISEIKYGFLDAASVMPNSIMRLWNEADMTANMLAASAKDAELEAGLTGSAEKDTQVSQMIINIVGVYEKALVENSFVNSVINSMDEWDRNPWLVPKTADENTGELDREQGTDIPRQTDAMRGYQTGEGETAAIKQGYLTRTGTDALLHQYAENNHTYAAFMSLFTGLGNSSFLRNNMVVKQETVRVEESSQAQAEALVLSQLKGLGPQVTWTKDEIIRRLKHRDEAADIFWDQQEIEAEADSIYATMTEEGALSLLDADGAEVITQAGTRGVYQSLASGLLQFGHPSLQGINVSREMRDKIAEEWNTELIQEGVDFGLTQQEAEYRAKRIWLGDFGDPSAPGLRSLLYDTRIPYKQEIKYDQLNTTYMLGPDGRPWATPFQRQNILQAAGLPLPHLMHEIIPGVTKRDQRGNTVDLVAGVNTGLKGLVPTAIIPEEDEKPDDKPFEKAAAKTYTPSRKPYKFKRGSYGGGGGGYESSPFFQRMQPLPGGQAPRFENIPMINVNTPYIRRAQIHRERIQSERGRLKQWQ